MAKPTMTDEVLAAARATQKVVDARNQERAREIAQLPNTSPTSTTVWDGRTIPLQKSTER